MVLPGINLDKNLPGYDFAKMSGVGAADFDFKALGAAMDCHREFAHAGIIYSDGPNASWCDPAKDILKGKVE